MAAGRFRYYGHQQAAASEETAHTSGFKDMLSSFRRDRTSRPRNVFLGTALAVPAMTGLIILGHPATHAIPDQQEIELTDGSCVLGPTGTFLGPTGGPVVPGEGTSASNYVPPCSTSAPNSVQNSNSGSNPSVIYPTNTPSNSSNSPSSNSSAGVTSTFEFAGKLLGGLLVVSSIPMGIALLLPSKRPYKPQPPRPSEPFNPQKENKMP